jgi:hypothetical protein
MIERPNHPAVRVDFQHADCEGRVRLNTVGTLADTEPCQVTEARLRKPKATCTPLTKRHLRTEAEKARRLRESD